MNSIREILLKMTAGAAPGKQISSIRPLHLVSPSATADSNTQIRTVARPTGIISYDTLARSDTQKLNLIEDIRTELSVDPTKVAIVYESTTFGIEACTPGSSAELAICKNALKIPLPVNIADVRYGLQQKAAAKAQGGELQSLLPGDVMHLSLEQGAENGSEFPESQQSSITAASTELELQRLIATLSANGAKLVIVIATDVRDRLFLIEQIADRLDGALYIDLGADRLLGHPDFIHATRGMLTLSSSPLTTLLTDRRCFKDQPVQYHVWSTDEQASLACAIASWSQVPADKNSAPIPYVVSRIGLTSSDDPPPDTLRQFASVLVTTALCVIFAIYGVILAIHKKPAAHSNTPTTNQLKPRRCRTSSRTTGADHHRNRSHLDIVRQSRTRAARRSGPLLRHLLDKASHVPLVHGHDLDQHYSPHPNGFFSDHLGCRMGQGQRIS